MSIGLDRSLGLPSLLGVVMGAIIGVGIFFTPRHVMDIAGGETVFLAAWAVGGFIALTGALTFAELGVLFPRTGGQYHVLKGAWGRPTAFLYCWSLLTVIQSGAIAIIGLICARNVAAMLGLECGPVGARIGASVLIGSLTMANALGVRGGASIATVTTLLKACILLGLVAVGLLCDPEAPLVVTRQPQGDGSWGLLLPALVPVLFSFGGWQQGLYVAGEVRNPGRNLPIGIIGGVTAVAILYVLVGFGFTSLMTPGEMVSARALSADAVGSVFSETGRRITAAAVALSALGVASVCIMTAPRMYKAMSDDGSFFAFLGAVHPRFRTPARAVFVQGAISVGMVAALGLERLDYLLTGVVCIDWVFFLATGLALFVLRRRLPEAERAYRAWGYPVVPAVFAMAAAAIIVAAFMDPKTASASRVAVGVVLTGVGAYGWFRMRIRTRTSSPD